MKSGSLVRVPGYNRPAFLLSVIAGIASVAILQPGLPYVEHPVGDVKPFNEPEPAPDEAAPAATPTPRPAKKKPAGGKAKAKDAAPTPAPVL